MAKLAQIDVVYQKSKGRWVAKLDGKKIEKASTKAELVESVTRSVKAKGKPRRVRIHRKDGTFQEDRTYPRSAHPRKSKG